MYLRGQVLLVGRVEAEVRPIHQEHLLEVLGLVGKGMREVALVMLLPLPMLVAVEAQEPLGLIIPLVGLEMVVLVLHLP